MRQLACFPDAHQHQLVQLLEPGSEQLVIVQQFVGGEQLVVFELAVLVQQLVAIEQLTIEQLVEQQPLVFLEQQLVVFVLLFAEGDVKAR